MATNERKNKQMDVKEEKGVLEMAWIGRLQSCYSIQCHKNTKYKVNYQVKICAIPSYLQT